MKSTFAVFGALAILAAGGSAACLMGADDATPQRASEPVSTTAGAYTAIPAFPPELRQEYEDWRANQEGRGPTPGTSFLKFHRDFRERVLAWYRAQPNADMNAVAPWTSVPERMFWRDDNSGLEGGAAERALQERVGLAMRADYANEEAFGLDMIALRADLLKQADHRQFDPTTPEIHADDPRAAIFYNVDGLIDYWWRRVVFAQQWCSGLGARFANGDLNGDGNTDLLCNDPSYGRTYVALANPQGDFLDESYNLSWCGSSWGRLHVADFDGDGRDDVLCDDSSTGTKTFAFGTPSGKLAPVSGELYWCTGNNVELHVGDFNGDGKTDLLCSRTTDGYKWFAIADAFGRFSPASTQNYQIDMHWCFNGDHLFVADFDGDRRSDLLCHNPRDGFAWTAYADDSGHFHGTDRTMSSLCYLEDATLLVGDANRDGRSDLLCHQSGYVTRWISTSRDSDPYSIGPVEPRFCSGARHHLLVGKRGADLTLTCDFDDPRRKVFLSPNF